MNAAPLSAILALAPAPGPRALAARPPLRARALHPSLAVGTPLLLTPALIIQGKWPAAPVAGHREVLASRLQETSVRLAEIVPASAELAKLEPGEARGVGEDSFAAMMGSRDPGVGGPLGYHWGKAAGDSINRAIGGDAEGQETAVIPAPEPDRQSLSQVPEARRASPMHVVGLRLWVMASALVRRVQSLF